MLGPHKQDAAEKPEPGARAHANSGLTAVNLNVSGRIGAPRRVALKSVDRLDVWAPTRRGFLIVDLSRRLNNILRLATEAVSVVFSHRAYKRVGASFGACNLPDAASVTPTERPFR